MVLADREVRKVEEGAGHAEHGCRYVEHLPAAPCDIGGLGERQPLDVVARLRTVLQQPHEHVQLRHVLDDLVAAEADVGARPRKRAFRIHVLEGRAAVGGNRGVPVAGVDHDVAVDRAARLADVGCGAVGRRAGQLGVAQQLYLVACGARRHEGRRQLDLLRYAENVALGALPDQRQQMPGMNPLRPLDRGRGLKQRNCLHRQSSGRGGTRASA